VVQWRYPSLTAIEDKLSLERELYGRGLDLVVGIDEVGRGPLAGPVVAAAVVLPTSRLLALIEDRELAHPLLALDDSKRLSEAKREVLARAVLRLATACSLGSASASEIDDLNILRATFLAMRRALEALTIVPHYLLIDGNHPLPDLPFDVPQQAVVKGDARCFCMAAASIVAKVHRDREMLEYEARFPGYGFGRHKGYGTAEHRGALLRLGPCAEHRRSFLSGLLREKAR